MMALRESSRPNCGQSSAPAEPNSKSQPLTSAVTTIIRELNFHIAASSKSAPVGPAPTEP
jgi:hypothetical protein